jgi:serine/threonine protein kinase
MASNIHFSTNSRPIFKNRAIGYQANLNIWRQFDSFLKPDINKSMHSSSSNKSPVLTISKIKNLIQGNLELSPESFEFVRVLGTGAYAVVWLAYLKEDTSRTPFAIKVIHKYSTISKKQVENVRAEREILSQVTCPFVTELLASFQDKYSLYLIFEFYQGGELFGLLRLHKRMKEKMIAFYLAEIALSISFLHKGDIMYRDLKPENILIDAEGHTKLTDFGFAKRILKSERTLTICGTPEYLAPEIISPSKQGYGRNVDLWTLGVLAYELAVGYDNKQPAIFRREAT